MAQIINGITYYRTAEVYRMMGISRSTFFRWLRAGTLDDAAYADRRGWRLFTGEELEKLKNEANQVVPRFGI
ncbi:MerR family transcriptional regulator [Chloroflexota bacterium]